MPRIKAILFDLDGTVNDTVTDLALSVNHALSMNGLPVHPIDSYKRFAGNGMRKMVERAMPEGEKQGDLYEKVVRDYAEYYSVHSMDNTVPFDGIRELIDELRRLGFLIAVVTNKPDSQAKALLDGMFPGKFNAVVGQTDGTPTKPDPAMPNEAMRIMGVTPEECVFVGDSDVDILTGINCGAYPVGVLWGFRDREELIKSGAREIISKPSELLGVIGRRCKDVN